MHKFFIEMISPKELAPFMDAFNDVWIRLFFVFTALFFTLFLLVHFLVKSVTDEVRDIKEYLQEINKKNYGAVLKIKHHLEFLELTVLLKNIVKRLKNKSK